MVKDFPNFQGWFGEAWEVSGGSSWLSASPLSEGPDLVDPGIRGHFLEVRTGEGQFEPVCLQGAPGGPVMVVPVGQGACVDKKAEPIGVPTEYCPLRLNPALKAGERYLVSLDYPTRNQWWGDEVKGVQAGSFVQYLAPVGISQFPPAIWRFSLTASGGLPVRALFVLNAIGDGTMLWFCQRGFGHYLIDNVPIGRLP